MTRDTDRGRIDGRDLALDVIELYSLEIAQIGKGWVDVNVLERSLVVGHVELTMKYSSGPGDPAVLSAVQFVVENGQVSCCTPAVTFAFAVWSFFVAFPLRFCSLYIPFSWLVSITL